MADVAEVLKWRGRTAVGPDGSKLGKIEEIYLDEETDHPEWALINTGIFGGKSSFMPLQGARSDGDQITTPYSKDQVKNAPEIHSNTELSPEEERSLYEHYEIAYGRSRSDGGRPGDDPTMGRGQERRDRADESVDRDVSDPTTDGSITREVRVEEHIVEKRVLPKEQIDTEGAREDRR